MIKLTDEQAHDLYLATGWTDPLNNPYPDPEIAKEVRQLVNAPTLKAAGEVIEYWGWNSEEEMFGYVQKCRTLAGVDDGDIIHLLEATSLPLCHRAAEEIRRLRNAQG